ncbi:MAG: response regulator [Chloroflexi bacterium]|nr:response regulator [Chloroflexota bacterium]MBU1750201.1 response regulator [Chloroflexota bacterium]
MAQVLRSNPNRILVIEDEPDTREQIRAALESHGCDVVLAADGAAGWLLVGGADLIILDIVLPGALDGWQFLRRLKKDVPNPPPTIVISGLLDEQVQDAAAYAAFLGAHKFIPKRQIGAELCEVIWGMV